MMGKWYDTFKTYATVTAGSATPDAGCWLTHIFKVAVMPVILLVVFILIYVARKNLINKNNKPRLIFYEKNKAKIKNMVVGSAAAAIAGTTAFFI